MSTITFDELTKRRGALIRLEECDWMDETTEEEVERLVYGIVDGFCPGQRETMTDPGVGPHFCDSEVWVSTEDADRIGPAGTASEARFFRLDEGHPAFEDLEARVQQEALEQYD